MENFDFGRKKLLGIVFDLSVNHDANGNRFIDLLKINLIKKISASDENILAVVADGNNKVSRLSSVGIQQIDNYQEGLGFRVGEATKSISSLIGDSVEDVEKFILVFTDRYKDKFKTHYKQICDLKKIKNYDYKIAYVAVGIFQEVGQLEKMCLDLDCQFFHINEMKEIDSVFVKIGV